MPLCCNLRENAARIQVLLAVVPCMRSDVQHRPHVRLWPPGVVVVVGITRTALIDVQKSVLCRAGCVVTAMVLATGLHCCRIYTYCGAVVMLSSVGSHDTCERMST